MELKSFVQWSINQYLDLIQMFKQHLYRQNSNFQPNLVERARMKRLLYLTLLFNEDAQFLENEKVDILSELEIILDSLYEKVQGYWNGIYSTHMNLWKYSINIEYDYNCFFFQLFIVELFLKYSGDYETVEWIENYLVDIPIQYEKPQEHLCLDSSLSHSVEPISDIQRLCLLLESNRRILDISAQGSFRLDTLAVYSFYKKYFYMKYINKSKNMLYRTTGKK